MKKRLKRYALATALLPVCVIAALMVWHLGGHFRDTPEGSLNFVLGVITYFGFQWMFFRPMRTYVFGHELTHAMAAWMSGGKVRHFHVSKKGGSVTVTKSNLFVALAPYFVPIYSVLLILAVWLVNWFYPLRPYWAIVLFGIGLTVGFHASLTWFALQQNQPDLKKGGSFLSSVLIFLGNAVTLVVMLAVLFPKTVSWRRVVKASQFETIRTYRGVTSGALAVASFFKGHS